MTKRSDVIQRVGKRRGPISASSRSRSKRRSSESKTIASHVHEHEHNCLNPIARMFMPIFEGELGDTGFIELAQTSRNHAVVLFLRCAREGKLETHAPRQVERDPAVLRGVRRGEKASVFAVLHVFAIGFENARRRAGLRKDFAQYF